MLLMLLRECTHYTDAIFLHMLAPSMHSSVFLTLILVLGLDIAYFPAMCRNRPLQIAGFGGFTCCESELRALRCSPSAFQHRCWARGRVRHSK